MHQDRMKLTPRNWGQREEHGSLRMGIRAQASQTNEWTHVVATGSGKAFRSALIPVSNPSSQHFAAASIQFGDQRVHRGASDQELADQTQHRDLLRSCDRY